ncbi:hypothetical protein MTR67_031037 [Solanum verrucosum]|uniref:Reverse transcriptase domain-containing protein n=1 Tax=Solanum verrucosum TaxID=315347 RepID=A0AAF0ZEB4_SOLVR|nr:hypothetical protein MTR67_031037 [Solanum verrucosum]
MLGFAKFMKYLVTKKRVKDCETIELPQICGAVMEKNDVLKRDDPGDFTIPCTIVGVFYDVLVQVDKFVFPADIVVLDYEIDVDTPIILGRPFLATGKASFDVEVCRKGAILLSRWIFREQPNFYCTGGSRKDNFYISLWHIPFKCMPFGLCNAPTTCQQCMLSIFANTMEDFMEVFMDDFSVVGASFEECLRYLEMVFKRCVYSILVLNWEKFHFMVNEEIVVGRKISGDGIEVDQKKIQVIEKLPPTILVKGVRSFFGHVGFYYGSSRISQKLLSHCVDTLRNKAHLSSMTLA